jgi:hypothetical protein
VISALQADLKLKPVCRVLYLIENKWSFRRFRAFPHCEKIDDLGPLCPVDCPYRVHRQNSVKNRVGLVASGGYLAATAILLLL